MKLLFDIGGTKTRIAISESKKSFEKPLIYDTPKDYRSAINLLVKTAKDMSGKKPQKVIGGVPGHIDQKGKLNVWRNLSGWSGENILRDLKKMFDCPIELCNDAALAGLGEARFGAGENYNIVAYITLSTGVNGVRIVDKKIDANARGFEIGHQIIDFDKSSGSGNFESLVSGAALRSKLKKDPSEVKNKKMWKKSEKIIAIGLNNTILYWSPDVVVLGGGLMRSLDIKNIRNSLKSILNIYTHRPPVVRGELGDLGGLYGALSYIES